MCDKNSSPEEVIAELRQMRFPEGTTVEVRGSWTWLSTGGKIPPKEVRVKLSSIGFHWNHKREVWQHPGGILSRHSKTDPRDKYPAEEVKL